MRRHSFGDRIVNRLNAGILIARAHTVNILGVGTLKALACIAASGHKLPYDELCSDPFLTFCSRKVFTASGFAVKQCNIDSLSLGSRNAVPNGRLSFCQLIARKQAVTGFDTVCVFTVRVDPAKLFTGSTDSDTSVGNSLGKGNNIARGIITIIKRDRCLISCFRRNGKCEKHGENRHHRKDQRSNSFEIFS